MGTHALSQLLRRKQPVGFHHGALAMDPPGLNRVEPGTFSGQVARQGMDALRLRFHLGVALANPGADHLAEMPGGIIPNEQPGGFFQRPGAALLAKIVRAAVQQLFEPFGSFLREGGAQSMGTRRSFLQDMQCRGVELVDHVAHSLVVAAQLAGAVRLR